MQLKSALALMSLLVPLTLAITIGGAKADELFVAAGERIFARKIQGKASYTLKKEK